MFAEKSVRFIAFAMSTMAEADFSMEEDDRPRVARPVLKSIFPIDFIRDSASPILFISGFIPDTIL